MPEWRSYLDRWQSAGLLDAEAVQRITDFERQAPAKLRWPIVVALAFGGVLISAGLLLFVAAHWEEMSPASRFLLVLLMVASAHAGGAAAADRWSALAVTLHAIGTVALGAGLALTGQIFNLREHWPTGILLWSAGAVLAWWVLRHWTQAALTAMLVPGWLTGECLVARWSEPAVASGLALLAVVYLTCDRGESATRRAISWIGAIALLPMTAAAAFDGLDRHVHNLEEWLVALMIPLLVAAVDRRAEAVWTVAAAAWLGALAAIAGARWDLLMYGWLALGAVGLVAWGVRDGRTKPINLGIAGFAITVTTFYFSSVMDKLDRSLSLIGLGVLFLAGGWAIERTRRGLVARIRKEAV